MELDRIVEQRLSPQYVSVHATDPEVRRYLLGRKRPDDVLGKMRYLIDHGIELHAQIVLCPTINDGDVLNRTIADLSQLHPGLKSVAVVPVVFTKLHNYRHLMTAVSEEFARESLGKVKPLQREFRRRFGTTFVFLADEFYLRAGLQVPGRSHYGSYPQIEDGVGMVRRFVSESRKMLRRDVAAANRISPGSLRGTVVTGELFYPILAGVVDQVNDQTGALLKVVSVPNRFFGEEVTVAGLMAGGDVLSARDSLDGEFILVPEQACLKQGSIFLDDLSLDDLERELGRPVSHGGGSIVEMLKRAIAAEKRVRAAPA
jgi:putative radical SAM enzyme (TIGR03279 family)